MEALIPLFAIFAVFGLPAYVVKRVMDSKERRLELEAYATKQLAAGNDVRQELLARIESLEAIVHDGDYELNRQMRLVAKDEEKRLASQEPVRRHLSDVSGTE